MARSDAQSPEIEKLLEQWRQGDCVVQDGLWFVFRTHIENPLTDSARDAAMEGKDLVEEPVAGFMVVTQTCDIVRSPENRPFVEIAPLVPVSDKELQQVKRCHYIRFAYVPGVANQNLVADLDRSMTIEKSVLVRWSPIRGCQTDEEARQLALCLQRKRSRFAFPDDFTDFVRPLADRIKEKHDKNTPEGQALRILREIRVQAEPSWDAAKILLMFWFIRSHDDDVVDINAWVKVWLKLLPPSGRFRATGEPVRLEEMTAADYVASEPLDLEYLSSRSD